MDELDETYELDELDENELDGLDNFQTLNTFGNNIVAQSLSLHCNQMCWLLLYAFVSIARLSIAGAKDVS